mmetsp:Transcript_14626/g.31873  ORF Transcript_14626/g.31873 Transcript_14626/m.31873 type:complete len:222 (+) Transcript_14626:115-780(+)
MDDSVTYALMPASMVSDEHIAACAQLFSEHYGTWGKGSGKLEGSRVRLPATKLKAQGLFNTECTLCMATINGTLVGHAFATTFPYQGNFVTWITQLCVHTDHRSRGIASRLCRLSWDIRSNFACGLVSSHPHAVRALERATQLRCDPELSMRHASGLVEACEVPYVRGCAMSSSGACAINTSYFVDHTCVNQLVADTPDWRLGALGDGEEYFAFVFGKRAQ